MYRKAFIYFDSQYLFYISDYQLISVFIVVFFPTHSRRYVVDYINKYNLRKQFFRNILEIYFI